MTTQSPSASPCVLVIFGAGGDLTQRLLMPALYNLRRAKLLPENFAVIGIARARKGDGAFRKELADALGTYGDKEPIA
jgi:glucose-6-phosphate 1-dehydrogenase